VKLTLVMDTLTLFSITRLLIDASVTSGALTCVEVEKELVECARESSLDTLPVFLDLKQFEREVRMASVNVG